MQPQYQICRIFTVVIITSIGCADIPQEFAYRSSENLSNLVLDGEEGNHQFASDMKPLHLAVNHNGTMLTNPLTVNLACTNVFGSSGFVDWTQNGVSAASGGTVQMPNGFACTVTLASYFDGTNTYTAISAALAVSVSSTGGVTPVTTPVGYQSGSLQYWFTAASGGTNSIIFYFNQQTVSSTAATSTTLTTASVTLTVASVPAPTISTSPTIYSVTANGSTSYTLIFPSVTATGTLGCAYIANTGGTLYTPTSWSSVNTAYAAGTACTLSSFTDGTASTGNWTSQWTSTTPYMVIWANTINNINSYVVYTITG